MVRDQFRMLCSSLFQGGHNYVGKIAAERNRSALVEENLHGSQRASMWRLR